MHLDACTACRGGGPETCKASFKEWVPWNLTRGTLKVPGSDFKVLPGEGALSGELTDFVPGVFRKWQSGRKEGKGLLGRAAISHTTGLYPKQGWSIREGSTCRADGKELHKLKSRQPLPGTPETEKSKEAHVSYRSIRDRPFYCSDSQGESAHLERVWESGGLNLSRVSLT